MLAGLLLALLPADLPPQAMTFRGPHDWTFEASVHVPEDSSGPAVLLIGGGIGNDLDWTAPGTLLIDGTSEQITMTGEAHADAPRIAKPLVDRGCMVMHYSTIARDDPKRDRYPYEVGMIDPREHMDLARAAMDALAAHPEATQRPLVVLGFSMGAQRAVQLACERDAIAAIVLLSGAQMTAAGPRDGGTPLPTHDKFGLPIGEAILKDLKRPTLVLYGDLDDTHRRHAPRLADRWPWVDVRLLPEIGHQLGPEQDGRIGPIDTSVCDMVATWVCEAAGERK
ncbi:MAG: dienelactone hydrolase family protein [Phycisphaerales bacterium]|nr:dienelactone hydrolase family protein [Phycisphaerales bacterium]